MSDGIFVVLCVFALAFLYFGTRIIVAVIGRRAVTSVLPDEAERRIATLTTQVEHLQHAVDSAEREIERLGNAQRFTDRLV